MLHILILRPLEGESHDITEEEAEYYSDEDSSSSGYSTEEEYDPLAVTLSAYTETGNEESSIPVLRQRSYTGRAVIPSALANSLCADLGVGRILEELNITLGTSYPLDSVISVLGSYVAQGLDFGTTYAYLRLYWRDIPTIEHRLRTNERNDSETRRNAVVDNRITKTNISPRRIWDLYANRVVPQWVVRKRPVGVSHAWVSDEERMDVMTPINGYEWPVPIPKDANLDLIRIELLNLGAQYVWLDVLCLRQNYAIRDDYREEDLRKERLRVEEWKLDVPTIGWVYDEADVVCYFSGLGRPLNLKHGDFESDRCWFNRAWTVQETSTNLCLTIAGQVRGHIMEEDMQIMFSQKLESLDTMRFYRTTLNVLSQMQHRTATNPLDKVAGLVYLLNMESIPIYDMKQSEEEAWAVLVDDMRPRSRADLLFYFPEPGSGNKCWRPSWEQVMTQKFHFRYESMKLEGVRRMEENDVDWFDGLRIDSVQVCGLADASSTGDLRRGQLFVKIGTKAPHAFEIIADHGYSIPDGSYTLLGSHRGTLMRLIFAVGRLRQDGKFEKLSVFTMTDPREIVFWSLGVGTYGVKTVLC
ncbi:hypothetical protein ARMSODRAFT_1027774 [Armillaria solidipes]|uniref:Heterokaryon incompatibility domain-containing protein n=1 Tax=Armillaria solidipes TaxID=1076256 RepID=A0A2H3AJF3_9AGAR|nr:hypothetical protein ARMSODRAFT_1027774 [Armillaria solidipes]